MDKTEKRAERDRCSVLVAELESVLSLGLREIHPILTFPRRGGRDRICGILAAEPRSGSIEAYDKLFMR
jgi:hypothetical protein